jgi:hypothetical protein
MLSLENANARSRNAKQNPMTASETSKEPQLDQMFRAGYQFDRPRYIFVAVAVMIFRKSPKNQLTHLNVEARPATTTTPPSTPTPTPTTPTTALPTPLINKIL